ncbi:MAG: 2-dehydropantoate 2-reductase [Synergistaceae bacterium]|jgi:2-dehydropantoate 2-reductase|nr:2-dehydropantoate 2-reductase [Synergistaceae bacterium]
MGGLAGKRTDMDRIRTIAIVGLGAVGASYLSRISERVPIEDIRVIASGDRASRIRAGVEVNGVKYFFPVQDPDELSEAADLVIFAVKNYHLAESINDVKNQIGPGTIILSLLNGITSEGLIAETYGWDRLLFSIVMGLDATREGESTVYSSLGRIQFGEAINEKRDYSRKVPLLKEFFERAGVPFEIHEDMKRALWKKFMMNAGVNQTSAILRCSYGAIRKIPETRAIVRAAMEETRLVACREGAALTEEDVTDALEALDGFSSDGKTSMCQDVEACRKTEADIFGGTIAEFGRRHGVNTPVNETLFRLIKAIEASYLYMQ